MIEAQPSAQASWPAPQVEQWPPTQAGVLLGQTVPQVPQLAGSIMVEAQTPPQSTFPSAGHGSIQVPAMQAGAASGQM